MITRFVRSSSVNRLCALVALGITSSAQATLITTSNPAQIATFQTGSTVETFDNIVGITAATITDYTPKDLTGSAALFTKDPAQSAFYNSGGASFNNPSGNPGVPIGVLTPSGGILGDKLSGDNVAGPLGVVTPPFTLFEAGAFMEVIFPTAVSKVGLYVASGNLTLILKDVNNSNLATGDATGTAVAGQFLGISRAAADVGGVTILGNGTFTIDDFTYGTTQPGTGNGNGGGGSTVPDTDSPWSLAAVAGLMFGVKRSLRLQKA